MAEVKGRVPGKLREEFQGIVTTTDPAEVLARLDTVLKHLEAAPCSAREYFATFTRPEDRQFDHLVADGDFSARDFVTAATEDARKFPPASPPPARVLQQASHLLTAHAIEDRDGRLAMGLAGFAQASAEREEKVREREHEARDPARMAGPTIARPSA